MDEVYADLHSLTELVLLLARDLPEMEAQHHESMSRIQDLRTHLRGRLAAQEKELSAGCGTLIDALREIHAIAKPGAKLPPHGRSIIADITKRALGGRLAAQEKELEIGPPSEL